MIKVFTLLIAFVFLNLQGCNNENENENVEFAPAVTNRNPLIFAGDDKTTKTSLVRLYASAYDPDGDSLTYRWEFIETPLESFATLSDNLSSNPTFRADWRGSYLLQLTVTDEHGNSSTDQVNIQHEDGDVVDAWETLQAQIDTQGDGAIINLDKNKIYVLHSGLNLRNFKNITIDGNGATIRRVDSSAVSTTLRNDYNGGYRLDLDFVPDNYKVGDYLAIASGLSSNKVTKDPRKIIQIRGSSVYLEYTFSGTFPAGSVVFKNFNLISGLPSHIENGTNPGTIIQNIVFDGNARENRINYGWMINGIISIHGGKTSKIMFNNFIDVSNETIIGHGVDVHDNEFDGLNGSAFHTSVHDNTKELNGLASFSRNFVFNVNRIEKGLNGHSEGAITFSWGGGNLTVVDNTFISRTGNYGVMGLFAGANNHTDENLKFLKNRAKNFEYLIKIVSPEATPTREILITENILDDIGYNDFSNLSENLTIRIGCNEILGNTKIITHSNNERCE